MYIHWHYWILVITAIFHWVQSAREILPPGKLFNINGKKIHLYTKGKGSVTVILDRSLGGIEGYFLIDEIAKITKVCICDLPGYGWS